MLWGLTFRLARPSTVIPWRTLAAARRSPTGCRWRRNSSRRSRCRTGSQSGRDRVVDERTNASDSERRKIDALIFLLQPIDDCREHSFVGLLHFSIFRVSVRCPASVHECRVSVHEGSEFMHVLPSGKAELRDRVEKLSSGLI